MGRDARRAKPGPIVVPEAAYFRLRTAILTHDALVQQAQMVCQQSLAAMRAAMTAAGLDPAKTYALDDATLTATRRTA